jgi:hypothetical protein
VDDVNAFFSAPLRRADPDDHRNRLPTFGVRLQTDPVEGAGRCYVNRGILTIMTEPRYYLVVDLEATTSNDGS